MKYHRKLHQLRIYTQRIRMMQLKQLILNQTDLFSAINSSQNNNGQLVNEEDEQEASPEQNLEMDEEDFDITQYISSMPLKLQKEFRKSNPQLPEIFFMSPKEKKRYFEKVNNKFKQQLAKTPQRKSKTKKKINFRAEFDIRGFNQHQKVVAVKKSKQIRQTYQKDIHFS